jgi:curved DNA-binding protein CbpA
VTTHYDILGVTPGAAADELRAAYHERAKALHPDRFSGRSPTEQDAARHAMQDVNEAWRVLRDPAARAAYDRQLTAPAETTPIAPERDGDWLDRPYHGRAAGPGDVGVAVARAAPWVVVLVVLAIIVVFTAFAKHTTSKDDLVDHCIVTTDGVPSTVPCDEPNDGRVADVVDAQDQCAAGTTARVDAGGDWLCLTD